MIEKTQYVFTKMQCEILQKAREVYGEHRQMGVACEELCELAAVLNKFCRYKNPSDAVNSLHDRVLDEYADVCIMLKQVRGIFDFTEMDVKAKIAVKLNRLDYWLSRSDDLELSTTVREVPPESDQIFLKE